MTEKINLFEKDVARLSEIVKKLEAERKNLQLLYLLAVAFYVAALVFIFKNKQVSLGIGACGLVFQFAYLRSRMNRYNLNYMANNTQFGVGSAFQNFAYQHKDGFKLSDIKEVRLIPDQPDERGFVCRHFFSGIKDKMTFAAAEITTNFVIPKQKGLNQRIFLSGSWVKITLPRPVQTGLTMVGRRVLNSDDIQILKQQHGLVQYKSGLDDLDKHFYFFSPAGTTTDVVIPDTLQDLLTELTQSIGTVFALSVRADKVDVFLRSRFYNYPVQVKNPMTEQLLNVNRLPERDEILKFAKAILKLA